MRDRHPAMAVGRADAYPAGMDTAASAMTATVPHTWRFRVLRPGALPSEMPLLAQDDGCEVTLVPAPAGARLRCRVRFAPPERAIAHRRATGQEVSPAMAAGEMTLEAAIPAEAVTVDVRLRFAAAEIALECDGVVMDEDWPLTPPRGIGAWRVLAPDVVCALAREDGCIPASPTAAALRRWQPDARPFGAYWRPPGDNANAADVMLCAHGDELHCLWLHDRRAHRSKWGAGGHQFEHAVTGDLRAWRRCARAVAIAAPWMAVGTGAMVHDGERFHCFWHNHGERFGGPEGVFVSTSMDGERFAVEDGWRLPAAIQPGVWREDGRWRLLSGARLFESADLRAWRLVDERFIARPAATSDECPCVFALDGRWWLLIGRTGCWTWLPGERPQPRHETAFYDGLMVPMASAWRGRTILGGWLVNDNRPGGLPWQFGGNLMFREVIASGDGSPGMRWVPEMIPGGGAWSDPEACALADGGRAALALGDGATHLRIAVEASGDLSLVLGGGDGGVDGTEIRVEPDARRLLAVRAPAGPFSGLAANPGWCAQDFALPRVAGLARLRLIDVVVMPDRGGVIVDVQFDIGRTLAVRHQGPWRGSLVIGARGGAATLRISRRALGG
jgi:hypothetical protein